MNEAPPPPVPTETDLRSFADMPLEVLRLRDSDLATGDPELSWYNVLSWCVSWHQVPAGSLPADDATLARLLGFGRDLKGWKKAREAGGLRGWILHSDGRLYHPVVAAKVLRASGFKETAKRRRERDAKRLADWRKRHGETGEETQQETPPVTRFTEERQERSGSYLILEEHKTQATAAVSSSGQPPPPKDNDPLGTDRKPVELARPFVQPPRSKTLGDLEAMYSVLLVPREDRQGMETTLALYGWEACTKGLQTLALVAAQREQGKRRIFPSELRQWLGERFSLTPADYKRAGLPDPGAVE